MASREKKIMPPKLNKFMHPRNPYKTPPSFKQLATAYPDFRLHCSYDIGDKVHLDFKNPHALCALTTCLLHQDFGLKVTIPEGRLVPTLPLRLNYLLWLEDLLSLAARRWCGGGGGGGGQGASAVVGADIGTGAACVYPLLGSAHFGWCMLGTEADCMSYTSAVKNVEQNELSGQIALLKVEKKTILKEALDHSEVLARVSALRPRSGGGGGGRLSHSPSSKKTHGHALEIQQRWEKVEEAEEGNKNKEKNKKAEKEDDSTTTSEGKTHEENNGDCERDFTFDFTMCNPPFFSSEAELDTMAKSKKTRGEPCAAPTGSTQEKVTEGGEVEFIRQMVEESQILKDRVRIFTTLIGTKAHVKEVKKMVEEVQPTSFVFTEFCQGRTMRWGVAWTFAAGVSLSEVRSKKEMATNKPIVLLLPRTLMSVYSVPAAWVKVQGWLKALKVKVEVFKSGKYFVSANIKAFKPTWQHQRRRRRERQRDGQQQQQQQQQQEQNGEMSGEEEGKESLSKKRTKEEQEEERETKKARIATEEQKGDIEETDRQKTEETEVEVEDDGEGMGEEEGGEEEEEDENHDESPTKQNDQKKLIRANPWADSNTKQRKAGLKCILRCNFQVKQTGGLISMEAYYLGGSCGKDGLNQLVQYMRNQLSQQL